MDKRIFKNTEELNKSFTELLKNILANREFITVALSGGSTPKTLFDYWSQHHKTDIDWRRIKFFWGDERCVPPTDEQSNYKMTKEHLFNHIPVPETNIFRIKGENKPTEEAERYSTLLQMEVEMTDGMPSFDLVILGMGDDGHTASIFPHEIALWESPEVCVVGTHPETGQKRVSLSGTTINAARNIAFLVTGQNKSGKVEEIFNRPEISVKKYPAALVQPESGNLYWFLDEDAGKLLTIESCN